MLATKVVPVPLLSIKNGRFEFLDRASVGRSVRSFARDYGAFAGALVRKEARQSIRKAVIDRRKTTSLTGTKSGRYVYWKKQPASQPPRWRKSSDQGIRQIVYAWDAARQSVVIGPMKYAGSQGNVPAALEGKEGSKMELVRTRRRALRIGSGAVIRKAKQIGRRHRTTKVISTDTALGFETVAFMRIQTPAQLTRAIAIQEELFRPTIRYTLRARPFMRPALSRMVNGKLVRGEKRSIGTLWKARQGGIKTRRMNRRTA